MFLKKKASKYFIATLLGALLVRLILAPCNGFQVDINCFKAWAIKAGQGLSDFYVQEGFVDYPPAYIYVLYLIGKIVTIFDIKYMAPIFQILIKLPAILADLWLGYYLYAIACKPLGIKKANVISALYLWNPAIILNSAVWGQIDGVLTVMLVTFLHYLYKDRLVVATIWFAIAVLVKPQALILAPVYLLVAGKKLVIEKDLETIGKSIAVGLATIGIIIIPFIIKGGPIILLNKYMTTLKSYPFATLNAFNLHALLGGNWKKASEQVFLLTYTQIGQLGIVLAVVLAIFYYLKNKDTKSYAIYYTGAYIIIFSFTVVHKMHERYMYPALVLLLILYIRSKKEAFKWFYIIFSLLQSINVGFVLYLYTHGNPLYRQEPIVIILSTLQVMMMILFSFYGIDKKREGAY